MSLSLLCDDEDSLSPLSRALDFLDEATDAGTRLREPLRIEVVRLATEEDEASGFLSSAKPPSLREIKSSHHSLAKLLALGRTHVEASRITGYSPSYISRISQDSTFKELVLHYQNVEEIAQTDFLGSMREVGMDLLDELRRRVEESPGALTISQLQDGIKLLLVEPMKSEALRGGLGAAVAPINISFVASSTPQAREESEGRVIEGEVVK